MNYYDRQIQNYCLGDEIEGNKITAVNCYSIVDGRNDQQWINNTKLLRDAKPTPKSKSIELYNTVFIYRT